MSIQVGTSRAQVCQAIESVATQVAGMIRESGDPNVPIPKANWSVGDAAAHLAFAQSFFTKLASGEDVRHGDGTPASLEHANRQALGLYPDKSGTALADEIVEQTKKYVRIATALPSSKIYATPMGPMDPDLMSSYILTHLLMHGFPIAAALKKRLKVDRTTARIALPFIKYALPLVVNQSAAKMRACYQVNMRGGGSPFWVTLNSGTVTVHDTRPGRVDCYISADPTAFLLVGFKLKSQWPMIAKGKLFAIGLKPWLGFRFAGAFNPP